MEGRAPLWYTGAGVYQSPPGPVWGARVLRGCGMKKEKDVRLEIIRLIAIVLVVVNHSPVFTQYTVAVSGLAWAASLFISLACKVAVPLFFMISGGLLLHRNETVGTVFKKRISKTALVTLIVSLFYTFYRMEWQWQHFSLSRFLTTIYSTIVTVPIWFLYAYMSFLLLLPLLRRMAQGMTDREFGYLLVLHLVVQGILPFLGFLLGTELESQLRTMFIIEEYIFYPMAGYWVEHRLNPKYYNHRVMVVVGIAGLAGVLLGCVMTVVQYNISGQHNELFHNSLVALPTFAVYYGVSLFCRKHPAGPRAAKVLTYLGGCTFGIYLLEEFFRGVLRFIYTDLAPVLTAFISSFVYVAAVLAACLAVTMVLRLIPGVKKLL